MIVVPIRIGIDDKILDPAYTWIDYLTWILYVADVGINLCTTYIDNFGEEIRDNWKIVVHYMTSYGFWVDLLSLAALPDVNRQPFSYFGLLKLNRLFRLLDLIAQSNIEKGPKAVFQIVFYFSMLIIYLHTTGCLWFVVIKSNY